VKQILFNWDDEDFEDSPANVPRFSNEVIRASAGTGKTFQLSNRYIALAEASDRPDEILAATFARKAAGEILDRVVLRLAEAACDSKKLAELARLIQEQNAGLAFDAGVCIELLCKLIRNLHRLRISTLDSFFVQIAGSFGLELGLPPGWAIVDEVADQRLRSLAIQDVLSEGNVSELLTLLHLLNKGDVSRAVSEQIRRTANELYNLYRETTPDSDTVEIPPVWKSIPRYKKLEEAEWEQALNSLALLQFPDNSRFQNICERDLEVASEGHWEKLLSGGFVKVLIEGKTTYYNKPIPPEVAAVYAPIVEHVKAQLVNRIADQTEATWKLLDHFHRAYQRLKNDQRAFRFQDITQMLASAMAEMDSGQINFRLDAGVGHLLLDEFQDTSLLQWTVLRTFAETAARDPKYSFFCVGDVKQAIYGWRGGVADLFASLDQQIENLTERELTKSYRSSQIVIDVVNRVFGGLDENAVMPKLPGVAEVWRTRFQTHTTARDFPGYCVLQTATQAGEDENQQAETLQFAAGEIARLHRETPGASIGILVRKNQAVARMIYELRHTHGIEASEEGGNPLLDSAAVQLLLSLLSIADHPGDTIARFHVAHSALGAIVGFPHYEDEAGARRLSSEIRQSLLERGYGATIYHWVRELTPFCNRRELTRLLQLVSLAYRYESQATEQAEDFIETVSATKVEDPSAADVRVMNIHQSKGLQFDIVVLPELDVQLGGLTPPVVVGRKAPTAPVESVFRYVPKSVLPLLPDRFSTMLDVHHQQIHNEGLCLLYVAMTRAVHALHLMIAPSSKSERSLPKTYAGLLRAGLHEGTPTSPSEILYEHGEKNWFVRSPLRPSEAVEEEEIETIRIQTRREAKRQNQRLRRQAPSDLEGGPRVDLRRQFREDSVLARTRGSLWHAWLEHVDWLDEGPQFALPSDECVRQLAGQFLHPRLNLEEELTRFREALAQPAVGQALSREQYGPRELELDHNFPIAHRHNQVLMPGFIDRLVLMKQNGQVVAADVIDFKTEQVPRNDPQILNHLGQYYEPQLSAYREAIRQAFSLSQTAVSARLLFLDAGADWRLK
jgi:ATP-dependent helicase/nuclease subunit A